MNAKPLVAAFSLIFAASSAWAMPADIAEHPINSSTENSHPASVNENDVLATLVVLNKNEIAIANLAGKKNTSPTIKHYTQVLRKDHTQNLNETLKLSRELHANLQPTNQVAALQKKGQEELAILQPLNGQQFEMVFIDKMVQNHQAALDRLDQALAQNVTQPQLKKHLEMTRAAVAKHLQIAQHIQQQLQSTPTHT
jgi:putative membrane protein